MSQSPRKAAARLRDINASPAAPVDAYELDDNTYNIDKINTRLGDNQVSVKARVGAEMVGRIAKVVEQRLIPEYATQSDFIRDAIFHRLHWVENRHPDPALHRVLNTQAHLHDSQARLQRMTAEKSVIDEAREVFQMSLGHRDRGIFDEQMLAAEEAAEHMIGQYRDDMWGLIHAMHEEAKKVKW